MSQCFPFFKSNWLYTPHTAPPGLVLAIVEPRCHEHLPFVLYNVLYFIPAKLFVFTSQKAYGLVKDLLNAYEHATIVPDCPDNMTRRDYNRLVSSPSFYEHFAGYSHVLLFQTDSYVRKPLDPVFLEYDYVGAPWKWIKADPHGGNGGLSLRRIEAMHVLSTQHKRPGSLNEDVFFCNLLLSDGYKLPSTSLAATFSVESVFFPDPFGVHCAWKYFPRDPIPVDYIFS